MQGAAYNSLIDGGYDFAPQPTGAPPVEAAAAAGMPAVNAAAVQGTRPLTGLHNTPLHMALFGALMVLVLIGLRKSGFGFSVVGRIGRS